MSPSLNDLAKVDVNNNLLKKKIGDALAVTHGKKWIKYVHNYKNKGHKQALEIYIFSHQILELLLQWTEIHTHQDLG